MLSLQTKQRQWIDFLDDEDLSFLKRFVLASGSLKDVAAAYGVSYPTVRLRLDRLIARIQVYDSQEITDDFERVLRAQFADGKLDAATFERLLSAYHEQIQPDVSHLHAIPPAAIHRSPERSGAV